MESQKSCANCGAPIDLTRAAGGVVECTYCHSRFTVAKSADKDAVAFLKMGEHELDVGEFDKAFTAFGKAAECDKSEPEAYFGMALSEFKVRYLKDEVNDRLQPICYEITEKVFADNANYLKALSLATPEQQREYAARANEIDIIRKEFYKLKNTGLDYDCFICVKVTDDETKLRTRDCKYADDLYFALKGKGFKPFFSERELVNVTGSDYEARILYALYSSESMIVVCGNESYLQTKWVKNEYTRFLRLMGDEEKESDSITVAFIGTPVERLPGKNGKIQGIDLSALNALERVVGFVEAHLAANMRPVDIERRDYTASSVTRKTATRTGVVKRDISIAKGSDIVVSDDTKLNIAVGFLKRREFSSAMNWCKGIINEQPMSGKAYWLYFLAENGCADETELSRSKKPITDFSYFEKAISCTGDVDTRKYYYGCLTARVYGNHDLAAYTEYIALPESDEQTVEDLTEYMYKYAYGIKDDGIFDVIINTVRDTDKYINMNLAFARLHKGAAAAKYYKNILDADNGHKEALYHAFNADKGDMFEYCCVPENQQSVTDGLYSYGFNDYASDKLFEMCIENLAAKTQKSLQLFDYLITLIPKDMDTLLLKRLHAVLDALYLTKNSKYAKKYVELALSLDSYDDAAFFYRLLVNHGFTNPLEIITLGDDIIGDPDFYSAINSYTEKNKSRDNFYLDVNSEMRKLREKLGAAVATAVREVYVARAELSECFGKVTVRMSELAKQYLCDLRKKFDCDENKDFFELDKDVTGDELFVSAYECAHAGKDNSIINAVDDIKNRQAAVSKRNAKNKATRKIKAVAAALPVLVLIVGAIITIFDPLILVGEDFSRYFTAGIPFAVVGFIVLLIPAIVLTVKNKGWFATGGYTIYARMYLWGALTFAGFMIFCLLWSAYNYEALMYGVTTW